MTGSLASHDGKGDKTPMGCYVESGELKAVIRVTFKNTEFGKDLLHDRHIMTSGALSCSSISLILVSLIMAMLFLNIFGIENSWDFMLCSWWRQFLSPFKSYVFQHWPSGLVMWEKQESMC